MTMVTLRRARAAVWPAAAITGIVAVGGLLVVSTDLGGDIRRDIAQQIEPQAEASDRIMVIAVDDAFVDRQDLLAWGDLITSLAGAGVDTAIVDSQLVELANPVRDSSEFETLTASVLETVEGLVFAHDDVVLGPAAIDSPVPVLANASISPTLERVAAAVGFDSAQPGVGDDQLRTMPLVAERPGVGSSPDVLVPSVALIATLRAMDLEPSVVTGDGELVVGDRSIPTEDGYRVRVTWAEELLPGGSHVLTATEFLEGADLERLQDAIIVVGASGNTHGGFVSTSVGDEGRLAGPFIEAQAINTLMTEQYLRPTSDIVNLGLVLPLVFLVAWVGLRVPLWLNPALLLIAGPLWWVGATQIADGGRLVDPALGLAALGAGCAAALIWRIIRELRRRDRIKALFTQYVPERVARQLFDEATLAEVTQGERIQASLVFCDLRGFTPLCARLEAPQVRELLDIFYQHTTEVVLSLDGTVIQFVGDEVYAVFGAPLRQDDHAARAVECAQAILDLRPALTADLLDRQLPEIQYGLGVNSGEVVAAHTGSDRRRQYTALGDPVNVAARLCSSARPGEALVAEATVQLLDEPPAGSEPIEPLVLKGVSEPVGAISLRATNQETVVPEDPAAAEAVGAEEGEGREATRRTGLRSMRR